MRPGELALAIEAMFPEQDTSRLVAVVSQPDGSGSIAVWNLPAPQPTPAELDAALPAALAHAEAQQEMAQVQAMLDERYRMYTRALATGNSGAASEIQAEITDILAYLKELRDASRSA